MRRVVIVSGSAASGMGLILLFLFSGNIEIIGMISGLFYNIMDMINATFGTVSIIILFFGSIFLKTIIQTRKISKMKEKNDSSNK